MDLPAPLFVAAHGVLGLPDLLPPRPDLDEAFINAVQGEFPNLVNRSGPFAVGPPNAPRVVLTSTSSQLVLSPSQTDLEVRFYGDFPANASLCLDYLHRKIETVRKGLATIGHPPANLGLITTLHFSFNGLPDANPARHVLETHLRAEFDPEVVQDAIAKVALKVRDKYFVNLTVSNYESRVVQRPILSGQVIAVRPWEGKVEDYGVELTVDINNGLEGRVTHSDPEVTEQGVGAVVELLRRVAAEEGPRYAETGQVNVEQLMEELA